MIKILLIEDEPQIARFVQLELHHEGYHVTLANVGYYASFNQWN